MRWFSLLLAVSSLALSTAALAQRPPAPQLLPDGTLVYVRISNVKELVDRFQKTAMGRIIGDARVKPLLNQLYGSAAEAYQQIEARIGVPLDRLLAIPQGEACIAIVPPDEGPTQIIAWFDAAERIVDARQVLERLEQEILSQGGSRTTERAGEVELTVIQPPGNRSRRLVLCEKDDHIVISSDTALAKQLLAVWSGREVRRVSGRQPAFHGDHEPLPRRPERSASGRLVRRPHRARPPHGAGQLFHASGARHVGWTRLGWPASRRRRDDVRHRAVRPSHARPPAAGNAAGGCPQDGGSRLRRQYARILGSARRGGLYDAALGCTTDLCGTGAAARRLSRRGGVEDQRGGAIP